MAHPHHTQHPAGPKAPPSPYVEVTFLFRDTLQKPIEGLTVQIKAGAGAPQAPAWKLGPDGDDPPATDPASAPAANPSVPMVDNKADALVTDKDGYALTIQNAARNQPIDVLVKNQRGEYVWKATVTPKKDISAFTIVSPEYHLEATTKLTPTEELQQNLDLPVVQQGEVMTIARLVHDFGPYIGWSQKVTEQGRVKKDFPEKKKDVTEDPVTHKKKTKITIEHHYKVVDTGKPQTVALNVLGSRLSYPKSILLTDDHFSYLANSLGCEAAAIKALSKQETVGKGMWQPDHGFDKNGLPRILYERHKFYAYTMPDTNKNSKNKPVSPYAKKYPDICNPASGGFGKEGLHQYERFCRAASLDMEAAAKSSSWGAFQILGEAYDGCGFSSAVDFANQHMKGIDEQVKVFEAFMKNVKPQAVKALKDKKWEDVATYYNGGNWRKKNPDYAKNLGDFYASFK
ncbi:N-acetylmuramidase family protein [Paraburkholderia phymatum]|uniref:N-acetylmuramidase domain-containing protein n=1 Tax=Paraburkholderia phymatum (strain DSM 17167 / CIP 108236 / LMG 21445 / STM815) TaxID=391038 RepID=B2JD54_PARP8|nr:N-acetylmuramidase family protein [Paraburkholderia phymatum]ACC71110.1 hypothetical protein Bphy_1931 [Paraburkholderia phymatum STM815]